VCGGVPARGQTIVADPDSTNAGPTRAESARADSLAAEVARLAARLAALERDRAETRAASPMPTIGITRDGLRVMSADSAFGFRLHGYVQTDARFFGASGAAAPGTNTFLVRRARLIFDATAYRYFGIRIAPELGNGQVVLYDAYVDARPSAAFGVRAGKFRSPIGLERQVPASDQRFLERGLPANLVPNRDVGVQLAGEVLEAHVQWQAALVDGAPDGASIDGDLSTGKDVVGRVLVRPWPTSTVADVGIGIAASRGSEHGTADAPSLGGYHTAGQLPLFRFSSDGTDANTVVADGRRVRVMPQGYAYVGPVGVLAEYVRSTHAVRRAASAAELTNEAWQLAGAWMVSGERETFAGLEPAHPLDGSPTHGRGAVELVARYGVLMVDPKAFPTFADPATQPRRARAAGVGMNWRLTHGVILSTDYERTQLDEPGAARVRWTEQAVITRLQLGM
jgi:phosphate-selective porin OprO/OprP